MVYEQADWSKLEGTGGAGEEGRLGQSARRAVDMVASRDADYHAMCSPGHQEARNTPGKLSRG